MDLLQELKRRGGGRLCGLIAADEKRSAVSRFVRQLEKLIRRRGAEPTLLLSLRAEELVVAWLTARRIEDALRTEGVCRPNEDGPSALHPLVEALGKARDRLRRVIKEFEDALPAQAPPQAAKGLAEQVAPLLKLGADYLDRPIDFAAQEEQRPGEAS